LFLANAHIEFVTHLSRHVEFVTHLSRHVEFVTHLSRVCDSVPVVCMTRHVHMCDIPHSSVSIKSHESAFSYVSPKKKNLYFFFMTRHVHMCDIPHSSVSIKSHEFEFLNYMNLCSHTCPPNLFDFTYRIYLCRLNVYTFTRQSFVSK